MHRLETQQYRRLRQGPEAHLQRVVERQLPTLFPREDRLLWTAGSVPLGAGCPDIVLTACEPEVVALTDINVTSREVLAYLRAVGRAKSATISERLRKSLRMVERDLTTLIDAEIVIIDRGAFSVCETWRSVLPKIITIEVKVDDWRRAVSQAARNRIFSHHSFVALPEIVAERVKAQPIFPSLGIGLLGIEAGGEVRTIRRSRRAVPKVWSYYYSLAFMAAKHISGERCGLHRPPRRGKKAIS